MGLHQSLNAAPSYWTIEKEEAGKQEETVIETRSVRVIQGTSITANSLILLILPLRPVQVG